MSERPKVLGVREYMEWWAAGEREREARRKGCSCGYRLMPVRHVDDNCPRHQEDDRVHIDEDEVS